MTGDRHTSQADVEQVPAGARWALASALEPNNPDSARFVRDPSTSVVRIPTPFLRESAIYRVYHRSPYHPITFIVGLCGDVAFPLTVEPANFVALARADGAGIVNEKEALQYTGAYFETTSLPREFVHLLTSADDIHWTPAPSADEELAIEQSRRALEKVIRPPSVVSSGDGFVVTLFLARGSAVERHTVAVGPNGELTDAVAIVAADLPTVIGL